MVLPQSLQENFKQEFKRIQEEGRVPYITDIELDGMVIATRKSVVTALEARFGCSLCNDFQPEWEMLAKAWTKGDKEMESRLIFGTLDFADGKNTFQSVGWLDVD